LATVILCLDRGRRNGVPFVIDPRDARHFKAPEVVLLSKAKHDQERDRIDLKATLTKMSDAEVQWLRESLALVHPNHQWLALPL